jgi:hypothetical protein
MCTVWATNFAEALILVVRADGVIVPVFEYLRIDISGLCFDHLFSFNGPLMGLHRIPLPCLLDKHTIFSGTRGR